MGDRGDQGSGKKIQSSHHIPVTIEHWNWTMKELLDISLFPDSKTNHWSHFLPESIKLVVKLYSFPFNFFSGAHFHSIASTSKFEIITERQSEPGASVDRLRSGTPQNVMTEPQSHSRRPHARQQCGWLISHGPNLDLVQRTQGHQSSGSLFVPHVHNCIYQIRAW